MEIRQYEIAEELRDLGFVSTADSLDEDQPGRSEYRYYAQDMEKARRDSTEEELPNDTYHKAYDLVDEWFSLIPEYERNQVVENKTVKITKNQIKRIIREEKNRLSEQASGYSYSEKLKLINQALNLLVQANEYDRKLADFVDPHFEGIIADLEGYVDAILPLAGNESYSTNQMRESKILKEGYDRMIERVTELYQDGHDPRAAGEMLSTMWDEMDLQAALDMGMFGSSWLQTYVNDIIDEMNNPTGLYDEPDRGGGSRNRRW